MTNEDLVRKTLAESDYEGWVVWVEDGAGGLTPIFEHVPSNPGLLPVALGLQGREAAPRAAARNCMDWDDIPHDKVREFELYFDRATKRRGDPAIPWEQPIARLSIVDDADVRFFQMKKGAVIVSFAANRDASGSGQRRVGIAGWKFGYWNRSAGYVEMLEVDRGKDIVVLPREMHPCWPRGRGGFGLGPAVVGLTEDQIPEALPI